MIPSLLERHLCFPLVDFPEIDAASVQSPLIHGLYHTP